MNAVPRFLSRFLTKASTDLFRGETVLSGKSAAENEKTPASDRRKRFRE